MYQIGVKYEVVSTSGQGCATIVCKDEKTIKLLTQLSEISTVKAINEPIVKFAYHA